MKKAIYFFSILSVVLFVSLTSCKPQAATEEAPAVEEAAPAMEEAAPVEEAPATEEAAPAEGQ